MSSDEKKINAIFVLEIIGRPPEYLTETLNEIAKKISEEKGVKIKETKINAPVVMKNQPDFYTSFAEIEVEVDEILYLAILLFKYMPAHVEILSPQNINLPNSGWNEIFNEVTRRLHGYEEIVRIMQAEKNVLENRLRGIMEKNTPEIKENKEERKEKATKKRAKKNE